jgi:uncharacterized glyoxalase superfamily protein PhnB
MERAMTIPPNHPSMSSAIVYQEPLKMFIWLEEAFGFEPAMLITDADGALAHSEMRFGDGTIMVGSEWSDNHRSPMALGGMNTQGVHLQLTDGIDAHCARARKAGAEILQEPEDQFYGDRTYRARDPEGHIWTFGQTVKAMKPEEWDAAEGGLKTQMFERK